MFEAFYEQLSHSQNAEELINTLPSSSIDNKERIASLYSAQDRFLDTRKSTLIAMSEKWNPKEIPLYRHLKILETNFFSEHILSMLQEEMVNGNAFAFMESSQGVSRTFTRTKQLQQYCNIYPNTT